MSKFALIPLAGRSGAGAVGVIEALSGRSERSAPAVEPTLVELLDVNLYESGQRAYAAFRHLPELRRSFRLLPSSGPIFLRVPDSEPFEGLAKENSRSAELGLALALLMQERDSSLSTVAATGTLELPPNGGSEDRLIGPVGGLREKFTAIGAHIRLRKGGDWGESLMILTPLRTLDGEPLGEAHAGEILDLRRTAAAAGVKIDLRPVGTLREAAEVVGALRRRRHPLEWLARVGAAGAALGLAQAWALAVSAFEPMRMSFAPVFTQGVEIETPVRSRERAQDGKILSQDACVGPDNLQHVPIDEGLTLSVSVRSRAPLWAHDFLMVTAGDSGRDPKVFPMAALPAEARPRRASEDEIVWGLRAAFVAPAEEMKIVLLGRKFDAFDSEAVLLGLREAMRVANPENRINAAVNHLANYGAVMLDYSFRVVEKLEGCEFAEAL